MPDLCPHSQDIGAIKKTLDALSDTVFGNGKDGIKIELERVKLTQDTMHEDLSSIRTSMSAIAKSQLEHDIIDKEKNKASNRRSKAIEKVGIIATIVFGAIGLIYIILEHSTNH